MIHREGGGDGRQIKRGVHVAERNRRTVDSAAAIVDERFPRSGIARNKMQILFRAIWLSSAAPSLSSFQPSREPPLSRRGGLLLCTRAGRR
jgi:hypothetical protein